MSFELVAQNGIGLTLGRITKGEMSLWFLLYLNKLDNIMSFYKIVGACIALQFKKTYTKKVANGGWKTQSGQVCEHHYWSIHKIPTSKVLSKIEHASALQESPYFTSPKQLPNSWIHTMHFNHHILMIHEMNTRKIKPSKN